MAFHQAISKAFVSGLHATVLIASIALLIGAVLILVFVQPNLTQFTNNYPLSESENRNNKGISKK
jgi:ABC-type amino acid transport system permease subunit